MSSPNEDRLREERDNLREIIEQAKKYISEYEDMFPDDGLMDILNGKEVLK